MNNLLTRKFPIVAFVLLLVVGVSCSHEPIVEPEKPGGTDVHKWNDSTINGDAVMSRMTFTIGGEMVVKQGVATRTTTNYDGTCTFSENDLVAVAVTRNSTETVKLYRVKSDGSLEYAGNDSEPFKWKSASETVSIRAWSYGTNDNLSFILTAPETFDYSLETNQKDNGYRELLYCKSANKNYSSGTISLIFYHQLSRIVFNVGHELTGSLSVDYVRIGSSSFPIVARFSVPTGSSNVGTWVPQTTYGTIDPKAETAQASYLYTYSAVVFPDTYAKDTELFCLVNGDDNYVYRVEENAGQTLAAGSQYNFAITVKDDIPIYMKNPLWYMAKTNCGNSPNFVNYETGDNAKGTKYTWAEAMSCYTRSATSLNGYHIGGMSMNGGLNNNDGDTWHLPTLQEWLSIFGYKGGRYPSGNGLFGNTIPTAMTVVEEDACVFGFSYKTKTATAYKAYWGPYSNNNVRYAIRFLGTRYCSAWKYQNDPSNQLTTVSAKLITPISEDNTTLLHNTMTNLESEDWSENESTGAIQRVLKWSGYDGTSSGPYVYGHFWVATEDNANEAYNMLMLTNWLGQSDANGKEHYMGVRLFKDN